LLRPSDIPKCHPYGDGLKAWFYSRNEANFLTKMKNAYPSKTEALVKKAIADACDSIAPSEGRAKLEAKVATLLK